MKNHKNQMPEIVNDNKILCWIFGVILILTGVLNVILVHPIPGTLYCLFSLLYIPSSKNFMEKLIKRNIPFWVQLLLFIVIMWGTLAVGDLAEILGL